jgi:hypothetical protein
MKRKRIHFPKYIFSGLNKSRKFEINLLNHEKYIHKNPKNSEENLGGNLGHKESK